MASQNCAAGILGGALALLLLGSLSGCSLVGLGLGSVIDSNNRVGPAACLATTRAGRPVSVLLDDGRVVHGVFMGTEELPVDEYAVAYEAWRRSSASHSRMPMLGDSIVCVWTMWDSSGVRSKRFTLGGRFRGLGYEFIALGIAGEAALLGIPLAEIESVADSAGSRASWVSDVCQGVHRGEFPLLTIFEVQVEDRVERVRLDQVSSVSRTAPRTGKFVGLSLGLLIDGAIIALIALSSGFGLSG